MRTTTIVKTAALLALLALAAAAQVKNVAVVETELDAQSGASADLNPAEVRQVTAELRRQAVENLPRGAYNIMTSETVMAQGGAVLEECADENCVIILGSKIGADYIVRGLISKFQTKLTLTVEIYETENGNLVAASDPVRSEIIGDLLEKAAASCSEMYKKFADARKPKPGQTPEPKKGARIKLSIGAGASFTAGFGGGIKWPSGEAVAMPSSGAGAYLFCDATYAEVFADFSSGGGKWQSAAASNPSQTLPEMQRSYINVGVLAKYPVTIGNFNVFPLLGVDYEASISGKLKYPNGETYPFDGVTTSSLNALWVRLGGGTTFDINKTLRLRAELLYGMRPETDFEKDGVKSIKGVDGNSMTAHGLTVKVGAGINL